MTKIIEKHVNQILKDGFTVLKNVISKSECDLLLKNLMLYTVNLADITLKPYLKKKLFIIYIIKMEFLKFLDHTKIYSIVRKLYQ